jgi:hypothetical protein
MDDEFHLIFFGLKKVYGGITGFQRIKNQDAIKPRFFLRI